MMNGWRIPLGDMGAQVFGVLTEHAQWPVGAFSAIVTALHVGFLTVFKTPPPEVWVALIGVAGWRIVGWRLGLFAIVGLMLLINQGLWQPLLETLGLTLTATLLSLVVAFPLGICIGESVTAQRWIDPVLDFVQTMPRFVYLIPAVVLFGIDVVPAVFAAMSLAIVPPTRIVALALRQVDPRVVEAAVSFGSTRLKVLRDVKLPLIAPALVLAVNQCLMMALSMAVISALIGAGGLGADVLNAIAVLDAGKGFVAGFGIFILAVLIDRLMLGIVRRAAPAGPTVARLGA